MTYNIGRMHYLSYRFILHEDLWISKCLRKIQDIFSQMMMKNVFHMMLNVM